MASNPYPDSTLDPRGIDRDRPGQGPDEIVPGKGDDVQPGFSPPEVAPDQGDFDRPDSSPTELPPQPDAPPEAPAAPD